MSAGFVEATPPEWDVLDSPSAPGVHWTTVNVGEAVPGVQTPLSWTFVAASAERAVREPPYRVGALTRSEKELPDRDDRRLTRVFNGRSAIQCAVLARLGDRLPGTTGPEAVTSMLGYVPDGLEFNPTRRRYPVVALRLPWLFMTLPRTLPPLVEEYERWRVASLAEIGDADRTRLTALIAEARQRHEDAVAVQTEVLFAIVQPLFDSLTRLVERAGVGDVSLLSGSGGPEMAVIGDMWSASRGEIGVGEVVARHGFHGPMEGELSSRVWREDDAPLRATIEQYAARDESESPVHAPAEAEHRRAEQTSALLAALPRRERPGARLLLHLARRRILLRGVVKRSFLGAFDVGRAASRRTGELLVSEGKLADPDDVFYLTFWELTGSLPPDAKELVSLRRERRELYLTLQLPTNWTGRPRAIPIADRAAVGSESDGSEVIAGIGVSGGTVDGKVRVVTDPAAAEVEPGEVLVSPVTDPGWAPIMFISSALVVDVGGALSHAAVVARELEIPCVVNTGDGTSALRTGDRVRVDGDAGTVEVLERAAG